ncbi:MAG: DNA mismatch repair protein MutS, partial [Deltaproteobacteria bacterium]|nr:DNA mismatch repair protein MutS [Deltaproteobacteria bacterium]
MSDPRSAYEIRLATRRLDAARFDRWDRRLSWVRGVVAGTALLLGWVVLRRHALPPTILLAPVAAFVAAMVAHDRVANRRARLGRAIHLYERALARLDDKWGNLPEDGARFLDSKHPYAADLDLFGPRSLFQLLCTVRTAGGEATLAGWLLNPAPPLEILARQVAIQELRPRLDLREALWITGSDVRAGVDADRLATWGAAPPQLPWSWLRPVLALLSVTMAILGIGWMTGHLPAAPAALTAVVVLLVTQALNSRTAAVVDAVVRPETHLALLADLARIF